MIEAAATPPACPHCSSGRPHRRGGERWRCISCSRTFSASTGTPLARLRRADRLDAYQHATRNGLGVRRTARACGLSPGTVQAWRHRIVVEPLVEEKPEPVAGVISVFGGIGGLDLGIDDAGLKTCLAVEMHKPFVEGYVHARSAMDMDIPEVINDSVETLLGERSEQLADAMAAAREEFGLVGIVGGPPCPDYSIGGKQAGRDGKHGQLTQVYVDVVRTAQPDFFVFENVKGLVSTAKHREYYGDIKGQLETAGYATTDKLVNSLDYGVPQDRERIILIGFRRDSFDAADDLAAKFDWAAHATPAADASWPTTTPFAEGGNRVYPRRMKAVSKHLTVQHWWDKNKVDEHPNATDYFEPRGGLPRIKSVAEGDTSGKSFKRLHRHRYSPTAAYGNNEVHLHPNRARRISAAEALAIQSAPRDFVLPAMTLSDMFKGIGNMVPYLLARAIGKSLADTLRGATKASLPDAAGP